MLKVVWWGLLGDLLGEREDIKDLRIGSVSEKRNSLALERGYIKHIEHCLVLWGIGNLLREMRSLSGCTDW